MSLHLCARCLGIYSGLFAGSIAALFLTKQYGRFLSRWYLLLAFAPLLIHKLLEFTRMVPYTLPAATFTGALSGFLLFLYISNRFLFNYQNGLNDQQ